MRKTNNQPSRCKATPRTQRERAEAHFQHTVKTINKLGRKHSRVTRKHITHLSQESAWRLYVMNPWAQEIWRRLVHQALVARGVREAAPHLFTIIDPSWDLSSTDSRFSPDEVISQVRETLDGLHYVAVIDFTYWAGVRRGMGERISPHVHGVLWGRFDGNRRAALSEQFPRTSDGALGFDAREIGAGPAYQSPLLRKARARRLKGFAGAVAYVCKAPLRPHQRKTSRDGTVTTGRGEYTERQRHHVLRLLIRLTFPDITFAGGQGLAALRDAIARARKLKATPSFATILHQHISN